MANKSGTLSRGKAVQGKAPKLTTEFLVVTPAKAQSWLDTVNTHNRKLSKATVEMYARDILEGRWRDAADPIRFDRSGKLLDGQHRLAAVVKSGVPTQFLIVRGLEAGSQKVMDSGRKRSVSDNLQMEGVTGGIWIGGAARYFLNYRDNLLKKQTMWVSNETRSKSEVSDYIFENLEAFQKAYANAAPVIHALKCTPSIAIMFYYMVYAMAEADEASGKVGAVVATEEKLNEFYEALRSGAGLESGNPLLALRAYLIKNATVRANKHTPEFRTNMLKAFSTAWNAHLVGKQLKVLRGMGSVVLPKAVPIR